MHKLGTAAQKRGFACRIEFYFAANLFLRKIFAASFFTPSVCFADTSLGEGGKKGERGTPLEEGGKKRECGNSLKEGGKGMTVA